MRKAMFLLLGAFTALGAVAGTSGCSSSGMQARGGEPEVVGTPSAPSRSRWSQYLAVMTDLERERFFEVDGEFEREQWIRREGIDVRADLSRRLARGLSPADVRRRVPEAPDETIRDGSTTMMFFSRFNTQSRTEYWVKFENDSLVTWNSYTIEQQDRERELLDFQQRLMRRFNIVLERGMGMQEINRNANLAREDLRRVEAAHHETTTRGDYRGVMQFSSRNYIVAEQLLYARTRAELFEWFHGREPDERIIQRPFETHRYYMTHTDVRGNETLITAEFIFENGLLERWYVYHER
jgi:hypothetical protein